MAVLRAVTARRLVQLSLRQTSPFRQPQHVRSFFGIGEVLSVIANPAETLRQLQESRDLLKKAKQDMELSNEAKRIPRKHTFSRLPGFHGRETEQVLLRKIFSEQPKLNVIFGATSVGKTALVRQVLATDDFYVVTFDLRISGFADLKTLYIALAEQFEKLFEEMPGNHMENQKLTFKHLGLALAEKEKATNGNYQVTVADLAGLMESFQSCLLAYWEYEPEKESEDKKKSDEKSTNNSEPAERKIDTTAVRNQDLPVPSSQNAEAKKEEDGKEKKETFEKRPIVFLIDEAHKLPALVDDTLSLKVFLDTLLVLTKQDRLCHVLMSTSDSFFHHFLRSMNVGQHVQFLTIGDCTKEEAFAYYQDEIFPTVPDELKPKLNFDNIYDVFGGKLSHINDYVSSWVAARGDMTPYTSPIFIQAYTLLQFHLTHSGFETFSPLSTAVAGGTKSNSDEDSARFSPKDLIHVMKKLVETPYSMPYFTLCREIGTEQVDSMIKTRILELRWTKTVSPEEDGVERTWSKDGIERPIVLPMTRIIRMAMKVVLDELKD